MGLGKVGIQDTLLSVYNDVVYSALSALELLTRYVDIEVAEELVSI